MITAKIRRLERQHVAAVDFLHEKGHSIHDALRGKVSDDVEKDVRELFPYYQQLMPVFQGVPSQESESSQWSSALTDEEDTPRRVGAKEKRSGSQQSSSKRICGEIDNTMAARASVTDTVTRTMIYKTTGFSGWNVNGHSE
ncbi:hypothetical protein V7S43_006584 [Phytophthora oleae]|uniref:Uncharacterized protein n=1 Tax=Phytophthora oleae TaxID=2107226 RepID=A0ABD3FQ22_9STRA